MSFEKIVEDQIRKAIADGKFENLRWQGTALELESYFQAPETSTHGLLQVEERRACAGRSALDAGDRRGQRGT